MKNILKVILHAGLVLIMLTACEKTVFIELPEIEKKIVMNGLITPNNGLWLNLSQSVSTYEPSATSFKPDTDAIVQYYQNGDFITSIYCSDDRGDYYETDFKPQPGYEYKITVDSYGMPETSTVVRIPYPVEVSSFDTTIVINRRMIDNTYFDETEFFVDLNIPDPEDISNYYMLGIYYLEDGRYQPLEASTEDINMNIYIQDGLNILAWSDQIFNGQTIEFMINFRMIEDTGFETEILVTLYSIEEEYFKYLKSYAQNFTILNEDALLYEPVRVYSNISGGFGIVAAASSHTVSFKHTF